MAGDWIKMRTNLSEDPAVVRLASALQLDRFAIVGRLHRIWSWASDHSIDGQCIPVDSGFLDSLVNTSGFASQLRIVGWLDGDDGALCFPNFSRHNGESAKARALDALRKRESRRQSALCPDGNRTTAGPEKRRGEKKKKTLQKSRLLELFGLWWDVYPRKVAKGDAERAFPKALSQIASDRSIELEAAAELLIQWTRERLPALMKADEQYRKYPATWLNAKGYEDALPAMPSSTLKPFPKAG